MSDPTRQYSFAARPWSVLVWGTAVYTLVVLAPAISLWTRESDDGQAVMMAWLLMFGSFCLPVGLVVGIVCAARERLITRRARPGRIAWIGYGIGLVSLAHWTSMVPFTFIAMANGFGSSGHTADRYFGSASWGLLAWVGTALAAIVVIATMSLFQRRITFLAGVVLPEVPHVFPQSALVWLLTGPLMLVATLVVAEGGDGAGYALPAAFVVGGAGLLAATALAWSGASAETEAARTGGPPAVWLRAFSTHLGAFLAVQWITVFGLTLLGPMWRGSIGQRFMLQVLATAIVCLAAGIVGRGLLARSSAADPAMEKGGATG